MTCPNLARWIGVCEAPLVCRIRSYSIHRKPDFLHPSSKPNFLSISVLGFTKVGTRLQRSFSHGGLGMVSRKRMALRASVRVPD